MHVYHASRHFTRAMPEKTYRSATGSVFVRWLSFFFCARAGKIPRIRVSKAADKLSLAQRIYIIRGLIADDLTST